MNERGRISGVVVTREPLTTRPKINYAEVGHLSLSGLHEIGRKATNLDREGGPVTEGLHHRPLDVVPGIDRAPLPGETAGLPSVIAR